MHFTVNISVLAVKRNHDHGNYLKKKKTFNWYSSVNYDHEGNLEGEGRRCAGAKWGAFWPKGSRKLTECHTEGSLSKRDFNASPPNTHTHTVTHFLQKGTPPNSAPLGPILLQTTTIHYHCMSSNHPVLTMGQWAQHINMQKLQLLTVYLKNWHKSNRLWKTGYLGLCCGCFPGSISLCPGTLFLLQVIDS